MSEVPFVVRNVRFGTRLGGNYKVKYHKLNSVLFLNRFLIVSMTFDEFFQNNLKIIFKTYYLRVISV